MTIYLNIGSNQGDRSGHIGRAVALIYDIYPKASVRVSSPYYSESWGYDSDNEFMNVGVAIDVDTDIDPIALLDSLQDIERKVGFTPHRNPDGTYRDRSIDIDIIAIDTLVLRTPRLTIPHPHASRRPFVTIPLSQLAPPSLLAWLTSH